MSKRFAASIGLAAAIGIGGLTVAAVNPLGIAGAQDTTTTEAPAEPGAGTRQGPLQRALDALVADGTITQEQADAVKAKTKEEAEAGRAERKERFQARRDATLGVVADALGSTVEDVKAALKEGTSIAAQAEAAGVDRAVVEEALTAHLTEGIDQAVADGKLTEERAAKAKEHLPEAVTRIIDADGSRIGHGGGRWRNREGN